MLLSHPGRKLMLQIRVEQVVVSAAEDVQRVDGHCEVRCSVTKKGDQVTANISLPLAPCEEIENPQGRRGRHNRRHRLEFSMQFWGL